MQKQTTILRKTVLRKIPRSLGGAGDVGAGADADADVDVGNDGLGICAFGSSQ